MKRSRPTTPFLLANQSSIEAAPWTFMGQEEAIGDRMEHWDVDTTLNLHREISIDLAAISDSTGIAAADDLMITSVWRSDRTRLRGCGRPVGLESAVSGGSLPIAVEVPGRLTGGTLTLRTALVKARSTRDEAPLVAARAGSILWHDDIVISLEGSASRFPVAVLDFAEVIGLSNGAAWTLEWSPADLDQPVLGSVRLLVNRNHDVVVAAVSGGDDPRSVAIASMIQFDIARSFVRAGLRDDALLAGDSFEPDTVGRMLRDLLDRYWPGVDPSALRQRMSDMPHRFESELQSATGLLAI